METIVEVDVLAEADSIGGPVDIWATKGIGQCEHVIHAKILSGSVSYDQ